MDGEREPTHFLSPIALALFISLAAPNFVFAEAPSDAEITASTRDHRPLLKDVPEKDEPEKPAKPAGPADDDISLFGFKISREAFEAVAQPPKKNGKRDSPEKKKDEPKKAEDDRDFIIKQRDKLRTRIHKTRDKMIGDPTVVEKDSVDAYKRFYGKMTQLSMGMPLFEPPAKKDGSIDPAFVELRKNPDSEAARNEAAKAMLKYSFTKNQAADIGVGLATDMLGLTRSDLDDLDLPVGVAGVGAAANNLAKNRVNYNYTRTFKKQKNGKGLGISFSSQSRQLGFGANPISNGNLSSNYVLKSGKTLKLDVGYADVNRSLDGHYEARLGVSQPGFELTTRLFDEPLKTGGSINMSDGATHAGAIDVVAGTPDPTTKTFDMVASGRVDKYSASLRRSTVQNPTTKTTTHEAAVNKSWAPKNGSAVNLTVVGRSDETTTGLDVNAPDRKQVFTGSSSLGFSKAVDGDYSLSASGSMSITSQCHTPGIGVAVAAVDLGRDMRAILDVGFDPVGAGDHMKLLVEGSLEPTNKSKDARKRAYWLKLRIVDDMSQIEALKNTPKSKVELGRARETLRMHLENLYAIPGGQKILEADLRKKADHEASPRIVRDGLDL